MGALSLMAPLGIQLGLAKGLSLTHALALYST